MLMKRCVCNTEVIEEELKTLLINASRQSFSREQYTETCSEWQSSYPYEQVPASHC